MASGPLSPVMMIASSGLLENQGLSVAANLSIAIDAYASTSIVSQFANVVANATAAGNTVISDDTLQNLLNLGAADFPSLTDSFPQAVGNTPDGGFSGQVIDRANTIMGNGDLTIFAQIYSMSRGYQATSNQFINSTNNTETIAATFIDMDSITTGGLSLVTGNISSFGQDLQNLGVAINPGDIKNLGYPSALLRQIINAGGILPSLQTALTANGVTNTILNRVSSASAALEVDVERNIYVAMQDIVGADLEQVLFLLDTTTTGFTSLADLLDPELLFPNSYLSLLLLVGQTKVNIYLASDTINSELQDDFVDDESYNLLKVIIPPNQALANRALSQSFYQIKNVLSLTLPDLARSATVVQNNSGLTAINALTTPVPAADLAAIKTSLAPGNSATGAGNTFTLYDFVGTAAGYPYETQLPLVVSALGNISAEGGFVTLTDSSNGAYTVMENTLAGVYGNTSGPITGVPAPFNSGDPYANADVAFGTYISVTQGLISTIATTYAGNVSAAGNAWQECVDQYEREPGNWELALIQIDQLSANNRPSMMSIITNLHDIGADETVKGPGEFFRAIANTTTQAGQAVVASLREGLNIKALNDNGIATDTQVSDR